MFTTLLAIITAGYVAWLHGKIEALNIQVADALQKYNKLDSTVAPLLKLSQDAVKTPQILHD